MTKYWDPPLFSPKFYFTKMTQNGLKWILNITFKTMKFFLVDNLPPPIVKNFMEFFFLMKDSLMKRGYKG